MAELAGATSPWVVDAVARSLAPPKYSTESWLRVLLYALAQVKRNTKEEHGVEEEQEGEKGRKGNRMVQVYGTGGKRIDMTYS